MIKFNEYEVELRKAGMTPVGVNLNENGETWVATAVVGQEACSCCGHIEEIYHDEAGETMDEALSKMLEFAKAPWDPSAANNPSP